MWVKRTIFLVVMASALAGAILWLTRPREIQPHQATRAEVQAEAHRGGYLLLSTEELARLYRQEPQKLLLIDTRQDWEYRSGHIEGAVNFPVEPTWWGRLRARGPLGRLLGPDKNRLLVFYWAGLAWVRSDSAARVAVALGYKEVYRDPLGFPAWQAQGLPVARTPLGPAACAPQPPGSLSGWPLIWTLLGIFAGGLALNLTPCVYPLIPVTVSYFGGKSGAGQGRLLLHGLFYLLGLAVTNSALGVAAALTGGLLGGLLQSPVVLVAVAAVLTVFAASLFGFWEMRLPAGLMQAAARPYAGYFGSLFMGLTLGVVAAPCIGPFVLGLLTWVASLGSPWLGFLIFFTLSLGLGLPLFVLALFSGELEKLPRSGEWLLLVRKLMGWVLLGMAAYFIRPLLPESWWILLLAALALAAALHLGWLDRTAPSFRGFQRLRDLAALAALTLALLLLGGWLLKGPGVAWQPYSEGLLAEARREAKPVILDFSAAWCAPCRELENNVFYHPMVVKLATRDFLMIRVDLTHTDPQCDVLTSRFQVLGVPTIVFLDRKGQERPELRLVEYCPPDQMQSRMVQVAGK